MGDNATEQEQLPRYVQTLERQNRLMDLLERELDQADTRAEASAVLMLLQRAKRQTLRLQAEFDHRWPQ